LASGAPDGLLRRFWSERADCHSRLRELRLEVENYLCEVLDEIVPHKKLRGGRRRYEINFGEDTIRLDLPGCDDPNGLEMVYDWVFSCRTMETRQKLTKLEASKSGLEDLWLEAPTSGVRDRLKRDLIELETEISRLKHGMVDLGKLLRE